MIGDTVYKYLKMWLWIFIGLNLVTNVHGYASGYFPNSCRHMIVDHMDRNNEQYQPQNTSEVPFEVSFSYSVMGDLIKVTLEGPEFRGFMLEAWMSGTDHPIGNFVLLEPEKTRLLTCMDVAGYAVSHKNNHLKTSVQVNWMPDEQINTLNITFKVRVVKSMAIFWNFDRNFIMPSTTPIPTTPSTTTDTTTPSTTTDTITPSTTTDTITPSTTTNTTTPSTTTNTITPSTTTDTTTPSTTTNTTTPSTTTDTTTASTTTDTITPSTTTNTTTPSTTTDTTTPSTTTDTITASTTTDTTTPSTTTDTITASTTTNTTTASTTTNTTTPSTTTNTTTASTTTNTTTASTTTDSTTPSNTTDTTRDTTVSITITTIISTTEPGSNATGTTGPSTTTQGHKPFSLLGLRRDAKGAGTAMMTFGIVVAPVKMELPNILMATLVNSLCSRHLIKALKILCCLLCAAIEISALVLFCLAEPIKVTLIALVCVTIAINFVGLVIVSLPIGPSHELKEISNLIAEVFSVIHVIFTIAVIFVGVLDNDNCGKSKKGSWLVIVMIAFTVWIVLFVIWVFVRRLLRNTILGRNKTGSLKNNERWRQQRKKKKTSAVAVIFPAVSVLFIFGTTCFAVTVTDGIFQCQTN